MVFNTDYGSSEPLKTLVMLCYVKVEDQRGIIIEERDKTIDIIFIDVKQDGGRKDISKYN